MELPKNTKSHYLNIAGSKLHYIVCNPGKTQTIIMLHGFTGNHLGLATFMHGLDDFTLIVPDFPGFGYSTPMTQHPHTITGYATAISELVTKLNLPTKPYILSHSFGTVVAARLAAVYPKTIADKIILISPTAISAFKNGLFSRIGAHAIELHYKLGVNTGDFGDRWLKSKTISRLTTAAIAKTKDKQLLKRIYNHHLNDLTFLKNKAVYEQALRSVNRDDVMNYANKISQQALIISGEKDAIGPPKTQQAIHAAIPKSQLVILPGIGHLTHFEAPKQICSLIKKFLR